MLYLIDYLPQLLIVAGVVTLVIEVAILGFATFIFSFVGLALLASGLAMSLGWLDINVKSALWSVLVLTLGFAVVLWKPLKQWQNKPVSQQTASDFAQLSFVLEQPVDKDSEQVFYAYSGVQWKLKSEQSLSKGQRVKVVKTQVGVMWIEAQSD